MTLSGILTSAPATLRTSAHAAFDDSRSFAAAASSDMPQPSAHSRLRAIIMRRMGISSPQAVALATAIRRRLKVSAPEKSIPRRLNSRTLAKSPRVAADPEEAEAEGAVGVRAGVEGAAPRRSRHGDDGNLLLRGARRRPGGLSAVTSISTLAFSTASGAQTVVLAAREAPSRFLITADTAATSARSGT